MMISTKGRYALRVMLDLADHNTGDYIPLKDIAQRQEISVKYLENILASLSRANLVDATRGKGGGATACAAPRRTTRPGEILRLAEGSLASVSCLRGEQKGCEKAGHWAPPLWEGLDQVIDQYLDSVSGGPAKSGRDPITNGESTLRRQGAFFVGREGRKKGSRIFQFPIDFIGNSWYPSNNLVVL